MKTIFKYSWIAVLICFLGAPAHAQDSTEQFVPHVMVGASLTYIWDPSFPTWQEYTFHTDLHYALTRRWSIGINALRIWSGDSISGINRYWITGVDGQYNFVNDPDFRFFGEGGIYYGNYCTCGQGIPYLNRGNFYWALGGGISARIKRNLYFELGFHSYNIMSRTPESKYNYTQYILGLEYRLGRPRHSK